MTDYQTKVILLIFKSDGVVKSCMDHPMYPYAVYSPDGNVIRRMSDRIYKWLRRAGYLHCGRITSKGMEIVNHQKNKGK